MYKIEDTSVVRFKLLEELATAQEEGYKTRLLETSMWQNLRSILGYMVRNDNFYMKGMIVVPKPSNLMRDLLKHFHRIPAMGYEGIYKTLSRIKA